MPLIPKTTQVHKNIKKPSMVALRKYIRRSSVWDARPTLMSDTFTDDESISSVSGSDLTGNSSDDDLRSKSKHNNDLSNRIKNQTKRATKNHCPLKTSIILIDSDSDTNQVAEDQFNPHGNILDELYGEEWKKTGKLLLSEPRYNKTLKYTLATPKAVKKQGKNNVGKQKNKKISTPSSKKIVHENDSKIKSKAQEKTNKPAKSSWMYRLKGLCDDDSSEEENQDTNLVGKIGNKLDHVSSDLRSPNDSDDSWSENSEKSSSPSVHEISDLSSDDSFIVNETKKNYKILAKKPQVSTCESFLLSLSSHITLDRCDPSAKLFKTNFQANRTRLAEKLFELYNEKIFNSLIPKDTQIEWNKNLRKTGGRCSQRTKRLSTGEIERTVKITLSVKVLDEPSRLRDTLLHEMCHAACFLINKVNDGHGNIFQSWGRKAGNIFPQLPPVKRCHSYKINTKYSYRCLNCGYCYNRHSKSIDITRKCCGRCRGKFELLINKSVKGEKKCVPVAEKKPPTGFALFVKNNYAVYKNPQLKHGEIMKLLGSKFSELKVSVPNKELVEN